MSWKLLLSFVRGYEYESLISSRIYEQMVQLRIEAFDCHLEIRIST